MGMHHGIIAADTAWERLLEAMRAVTGDFIERGSVESLERLDLQPRDDGFPIVGGDLEGRSYVLDTSMMLATGFDRLAAISKTLNCTVAGCMGETVSGSYFWILAQNGSVRRLYASCVSTVREPFQAGDPLPTEAEVPWEDVDGDGFHEALKQLGFDYWGWAKRGAKTEYLYTCKELDGPRAPRGPLDAAVEEHFKRFEIPKDARRPPSVRVRTLADGSTGFDIVPGTPRRSLLDRIRGLFRGS